MLCNFKGFQEIVGNSRNFKEFYGILIVFCYYRKILRNFKRCLKDFLNFEDILKNLKRL